MVTRCQEDWPKRSHSARHQPETKMTGTKPEQVWSSTVPHSRLPALSLKLNTGCLSLHLESPRGESWDSADRLGNGSVAEEWGTLGAGVWRLSCGEGRSRQDRNHWLLKSGNKTSLENCKGMERVQLCTYSCYWYTHLRPWQLCHFYCFPESYSSDFEWQPISPKSPLQQFPLQQAHGKTQSSSGDCVNFRYSKCYCRGGDSPKEGMKRRKVKAET